MIYNTEQLRIPEERIVTPLTQVLNETIPKTKASVIPLDITPTFTEALDNLFPEQEYQAKNFQSAKKILGPLSDLLSEEGLKEALIEIEYLTESWIDDFERMIFKGLTLNEMLHEKGGI